MTTSQEFDTYIPVYDVVPEEWPQARQFLVEHLKKITTGVNNREVGTFYDVEVLSGKRFIPADNSQEPRSVLRKVIDVGTLANSGTTTEPHGLTVDANFTLVAMWGGTTDPVAFTAASMPNQDINLSLDSSNIIVTTTSDYSAYTRSYVIIEFLQEI